MNILNLPPNITLEILSYLTPYDLVAVRKVCHSFHDISYDGSLWRYVDVRVFPQAFKLTSDPGKFEKFLTGVSNSVQSIHLNLSVENKGICSKFIENSCPKLERISLVYAPFQHEDYYCTEADHEEMSKFIRKFVMDLHSKCPILKSFSTAVGKVDVSWLTVLFPDLESLEVDQPTIQSSCYAFLQNHPKLKELILKSKIESSEVNAILSNMSNIKSLELSSVPNRNRRSAKMFKNIDYQQTNKVYSNLQSLCFDGTDFTTDVAKVLFQQAPNIQALSLQYLIKRSKEELVLMIKLIGDYCPNIRILKLDEKKGVYDMLWSDVLDDEIDPFNRPPPRVDKVSGSIGLVHVATSCKYLTVIHLNNSPYADNIGIQMILKHCQQLQELEVENCHGLVDTTVLSIIKYCPLIRKLKFDGYNELTSTCIGSILINCSSLTSLSLNDCSHLNDIEFPSNMKLSNIMVLRCDRLSDTSLKQISKYCPNLTEIDIFHPLPITEAGIKLLVQKCKRLEKLVICGSLLLNTQCSKHIVQYCKTLQYLKIYMDERRPLDMQRKVSKIIECCPNITKIRLNIGGIKIDQHVINFGNVLGKSVPVCLDQFGYLEQQVIHFGNILGKNICVVYDLYSSTIDVNIHKEH